MTAVAVCETLRETYHLDPDIKWSNDVLIADKKISGILAETTDTQNGLAVIVGIGINLNSNNLSGELRNTATSIEQETKQTPDFEILLSSLTTLFKRYYEILQNEQGAEIIRNQWKMRSSFSNGKKVRVKLTDETFVGTTCGIEENGALRVKKSDGAIEIIQAGDVENLRENRY